MKKPVSRKFTKAKPVTAEQKKEVKTHEEFPRNSRGIPAKILLSTNSFIFLICFLSGILLMVLLLQENTIRLNLLSLQNLKTQRASLQTQIGKWQQVIKEHPDYRDGYIELAVLEYKLGDLSKATEYTDDTLRLDPNFQTGQELERKLQSSNGK